MSAFSRARDRDADYTDLAPEGTWVEDAPAARFRMADAGGPHLVDITLPKPQRPDEFRCAGCNLLLHIRQDAGAGACAECA